MSVKISSLEIENVKRVKAVQLTPAENGLMIIGGKNNQGKTSVLDAIAWALGGDRLKPSQAVREGSVIPPHMEVTLSNGIKVVRSGNNSTLKVIDPDGNKGGQQLLNANWWNGSRCTSCTPACRRYAAMVFAAARLVLNLGITGMRAITGLPARKSCCKFSRITSL